MWAGSRKSTSAHQPPRYWAVRRSALHIVPGTDSRFLLRATLEQDSGVEGSLMAVDNATGEVLAMVGGRDFNLSQFNRATQAERQTGSSFKPYVYTAAMEEGATPSQTIVDSPVTFVTASGPYSPHNYDDTFEGPVSLLHAFADSRNIPAVKLAERTGIRKVIATAHRFGLTGNIPPFLPIALGSAEATLEEQVGAYSSFPNDGIRIAPHFIRRVTNADGVSLSQTSVEVTESTNVKVARMMMQLFKAVVEPGGTAAAAATLKHPLGGKTGTTSNYTDAWFIGFSPSITCGVWMGYDTRQPLGKETGGEASLPIWMDWMKAAIADRPDEKFPGDSTRPPRTNLARIPSGSSPSLEHASVPASAGRSQPLPQ